MPNNNAFKNSIPFFGSGTTQESRLSKKILPEYARIHELEINQLIAFASKYAKLIKYYNKHDQGEGNWENFFTGDISVILADIISVNLENIETEHNHIVHAISRSYLSKDKVNSLKSLYKHVIGLGEMVNRWYELAVKLQLSGQKLEEDVASELENIIVIQLAGKLAELKSYSDAAADESALGKAILLDFGAFGEVWQLKTAQPVNIYKGETKNEKINNAVKLLRLLYRDFYNAIGYLVFNFEKYFTKSIEEKTNHSPDIALFISFLKLFRYTQEDLNNVSERYLNMYYERILQQPRRQAVPDEVNLLVELAKHVDSKFIPKGTKLIAGRKSNGLDVEFETLSDITITKTAVESLKTIFVSRYGETDSTYKVVTGIHAAPIADSLDGIGKPFEGEKKEWPLFGEEQVNRPLDVQTMDKGEVGFAIASSIFFLSEGNRKLKITFNFAPHSSKIYERLIRGIAKDKNLSFNEVINRVFNREKNKKNLSIQFTSEEGWFPVDLAFLKISIPEEGTERFNALILEFTIPPSSPSVSAFNSSVIEERFTSRFPILKFALNYEIAPYLYSYLSNLEIESIKIDAKVIGMKNLRLSNEIGGIDASQPFQPFGAVPRIGSYFMVGNEELFKKEIKDFTLDLEWANLPDFEEYYRGYEGFQDLILRDAFKVRLTALSEGTFSPEEVEDLDFLLFNYEELEEEEDHEKLKRITEKKDRSNLHIDSVKMSKLQVAVDPYLELEDFDSETKDGFIKIELIEPESLFGHEVYPTIFAEAVSDRAKLDYDEEEDPIEIPKLPYTPTVNISTLSYTASVQLNAEKDKFEQFFHVFPFGPKNIYRRGNLYVDRFHLLPQFEEEGYLFIGLKNLNPPQTISLLFQLTANKSRGYNRTRIPESSWSYLADNNWIPFKEIHHLLDTTDDFTRTGLIQLQIPSEINRRNTVLPADQHWIRVSVKNDTELLSHAIEIKAQAINARWVEDGESQRLNSPLPANTIRDLVEKDSAIRRIIQPFPSFGGQEKEHTNEYYRRVSERLRHKNRAVMHWDYERLILNKFHTIFQAKCLSYLSNPNEIKKGEITVVVVPRISDSTEETRPKVNYKTLNNINKYVSQHVSPFVKLDVRNPDYEYVRVVCNALFTEGNNNGRSILRLKEDLKRFICPWLYDKKANLNIGGILNEDVVLNFIKGLSYVKFVTKFSILHFFLDSNGYYNFIDSAEPKIAESKPYALQAEPWAIIIPDEDHQITIVTEEKEVEAVPVEKPVRFQNRIDITEKFIKITRRERKKSKIDLDRGRYDYTLEIKV